MYVLVLVVFWSMPQLCRLTTVYVCVSVGVCLCQSYASVYAGPVVGAYFARVCARVVLLAASGELPAGTSLS